MREESPIPPMTFLTVGALQYLHGGPPWVSEVRRPSLRRRKVGWSSSPICSNNLGDQDSGTRGRRGGGDGGDVVPPPPILLGIRNHDPLFLFVSTS